MGSVSIPVIFSLLLVIAVPTVHSLECYKCSYAALVDGKITVQSMQRFFYEDNDNIECEYVSNPLAIPIVTCPDDVDYFCGYTHAYITAYAHKVGKMIFHMHVRDCLKFDYSKTSRIIPGTKCLADQATIEETIKPLMPQSILSMHSSGKICYCEEDTCVDVIDSSEVIPGACPEGSTAWGTYCIPWWLTWLGVIDALILAFVGFATLLKFFLPPIPVDPRQPLPPTPEDTDEKERKGKHNDGSSELKPDAKPEKNKEKPNQNNNKNRNRKKKVKAQES